jgi:phosphonopyruvate decarboxylase
MINTRIFGAELQKAGFTFFSGVPCSYLKSLINYAINNCEYVAAANEGDAVAIASGAFVGGKKAVVLMQNSGLTNAISPLSSLTYPFRIPLLGFVSLRGEFWRISILRITSLFSLSSKKGRLMKKFCTNKNTPFI